MIYIGRHPLELASLPLWGWRPLLEILDPPLIYAQKSRRFCSQTAFFSSDIKKDKGRDQAVLKLIVARRNVRKEDVDVTYPTNK